MRKVKHDSKTVAIIGAGPAGLVVARWLAHHGFEPLLFESDDALGGQWNAAGGASATWSGMRTNTSRIMSAFSDLDHAPDIAVFPRREDMCAYLQRYAEIFDLARRIRFGACVEGLSQEDGRWLIRSSTAQGVTEDSFVHTIVAAGAQGTPIVPTIPGLDRFTGALGVAHTAQYEGIERYRGRSVLVAGCSISALEIASDLALGGAGAVTASYRRQRYILPKLIAGVPTDHVLFNRAAALAAATAPQDVMAHELKALVVGAGGSPEQFGAQRPDPNILVAGITQAQHFLPAVADGRITVRPWMERIDGQRVIFSDGSHCTPDAILFGTGYRPSLPWLASDVATLLNPGNNGLELHAHSFHPDLPGLAFIGLYNLIGPTFPVLELQARWIAYILAGRAPEPSRDAMEEGLSICRARRALGIQPAMHELALDFARRAGVEPDPGQWPELERALLFGPLSPMSFRLQGPDSLADASEGVQRAAATYSAIDPCIDIPTSGSDAP